MSLSNFCFFPFFLGLFSRYFFYFRWSWIQEVRSYDESDDDDNDDEKKKEIDSNPITK